MLRAAAILLALAASGCASADVEAGSGTGVYTITEPTDVLEPRAVVWGDAREVAHEICPAGWRELSALDLPSDVMSQIVCMPPPAG